MDARKFFRALCQAGIEQFFDCVQKSDFSAFTISRQDILKNILNDTYNILSREFTKDKAVKPSEVTLLGQAHNCHEDYKQAASYAYYAGENEEILMLESNGEVHPSIDPAGLLSNGYGCDNKNFNNVITEHELYSDDVRQTDPDTGFVTRFNPCLKEVERSRIMGLFLASLVATRPSIPITVIVGENHLEEIQTTASHYLNMSYGIESVNFSCHLSRYVDVPVEVIPSFLDLKPADLKNLELIIRDMANNYHISADLIKDVLIKRYEKNKKLKFDGFLEIINQIERNLEARQASQLIFPSRRARFFSDPSSDENSEPQSNSDKASSKLRRVLSN